MAIRVFSGSDLVFFIPCMYFCTRLCLRYQGAMSGLKCTNTDLSPFVKRTARKKSSSNALRCTIPDWCHRGHQLNRHKKRFRQNNKSKSTLYPDPDLFEIFLMPLLKPINVYRTLFTLDWVAITRGTSLPLAHLALSHLILGGESSKWLLSKEFSSFWEF